MRCISELCYAGGMQPMPYQAQAIPKAVAQVGRRFCAPCSRLRPLYHYR